MQTFVYTFHIWSQIVALLIIATNANDKHLTNEAFCYYK